MGGPFVAEDAHGHALHPNHQQPMQKTFLPLMQLAGQLTRHSAPATAKKSNIVMRTPFETTFLSVDDVELDDGVKKGKCMWFNAKKGFGAIAMEGEEKAVFVHQSEIHSKLRKNYRKLFPGQDVEFKFGTNSKGFLVAKEVTGPAGDYLKGIPDFLSVDEVELDGGVKKGKCVSWHAKKGFGAIAMEGKE